jgi:hypothetical protein
MCARQPLLLRTARLSDNDTTGRRDATPPVRAQRGDAAPPVSVHRAIRAFPRVAFAQRHRGNTRGGYFIGIGIDKGQGTQRFQQGETQARRGPVLS